MINGLRVLPANGVDDDADILAIDLHDNDSTLIRRIADLYIEALPQVDHGADPAVKVEHTFDHVGGSGHPSDLLHAEDLTDRSMSLVNIERCIGLSTACLVLIRSKRHRPRKITCPNE